MDFIKEDICPICFGKITKIERCIEGTCTCSNGHNISYSFLNDTDNSLGFDTRIRTEMNLLRNEFPHIPTNIIIGLILERLSNIFLASNRGDINYIEASSHITSSFKIELKQIIRNAIADLEGDSDSGLETLKELKEILNKI